MRCHRLISTVAFVAVLAGCAEPSADVSGYGAGEDGSALPAARELSGTWHGFYGDLGIGNSYDDEADCTLEIKEGRTFTATCVRSNLGANNLARPSHWSGRAVIKGNRVILKDDDGLWPSIVLRHSGNNILYGTTLDPLMGATVEMEFEHESGTSASPSGK